MSAEGFSPESPFSAYLHETRARFAARDSDWISDHPFAPDPEAKKIHSQWLVRGYGMVVWGYFVRAFWPCYLPGRNNHYGSVIVSFDPVCADPKLLFEVSATLRGLRQPVNVPHHLAPFVKILRDDYKSPARIAIPSELTEGRKVYFQSSSSNAIGCPPPISTTGWFPSWLIPFRTTRPFCRMSSGRTNSAPNGRKVSHRSPPSNWLSIKKDFRKSALSQGEDLHRLFMQNHHVGAEPEPVALVDVAIGQRDAVHKRPVG